MEINSILSSIKKLLGIAIEDPHFDLDLIIHINSVIAVLTQIGIGPSEGFRITGSTEVWDNLIDNDARKNLIQDYVFMKVKMLFDPPSSSSASESYNRMLSEYEWRIYLIPDEERTYSFPIYEGEYTVTPSIDGSQLPTKDTSLLSDIDIEPIPFAEVSNVSNGKTAIIGGKTDGRK